MRDGKERVNIVMTTGAVLCASGFVANSKVQVVYAAFSFGFLTI